MDLLNDFGWTVISWLIANPWTALSNGGNIVGWSLAILGNRNTIVRAGAWTVRQVTYPVWGPWCWMFSPPVRSPICAALLDSLDTDAVTRSVFEVQAAKNGQPRIDQAILCTAGSTLWIDAVGKLVVRVEGEDVTELLDEAERQVVKDKVAATFARLKAAEVAMRKALALETINESRHVKKG